MVSNKIIIKYTIMTVIALLISVLIFQSVYIVSTGSRGIEIRFGEVIGHPLPEGIWFVNPFTTKIIELDIQTNTQEGNTIAYTKDIQQAQFDFKINWNPDASRIGDLYRNNGSDYYNKIVPQVIMGVLKNTIGKWDATELIANRDKATQQILAILQSQLLSNNIIVSNFEITNIDFADPFERATEAKVVATQRAAEAENKTKQIQQEALQRVISAKAEAESMKIRSESLSQNKSLIEYEAVQKWDGVLPAYMLGGSALPFININK